MAHWMGSHVCRFTAVDDELFGQDKPVSITLPPIKGERGYDVPGAVWCWPGGHWVNQPLNDGTIMKGDG